VASFNASPGQLALLILEQAGATQITYTKQP
jgi:hypothetical protein